jgi:hypothetical protein
MISFRDSYTPHNFVTVVKCRLGCAGHVDRVGRQEVNVEFSYENFLESNQLEDG